MVLIFFQDEMGCCAQDRIHGGQLFRNELGDLAHGLSLYDHRKIIRSGHEINGIHLTVLVDPLRNLFKSHIPLGRHLYLDQGSHQLLPGLVPVDHRMVAADDIFLLHIGDLIGHRDLALSQESGQVRQIDPAVFFHNGQNLFTHNAPPYVLRFPRPRSITYFPKAFPVSSSGQLFYPSFNTSSG